MKSQDSSAFNKVSSSILSGTLYKISSSVLSGTLYKVSGCNSIHHFYIPHFYQLYTKIQVISKKELTIYIITYLFFIHPCLPKIKFYKNSGTLFEVSSCNPVHHLYIPYFYQLYTKILLNSY